MNNNLTFRFAEKKDVPIILDFIYKIAEHQKLSEQVEATEELLDEWIFEKKSAEVIFPILDKKPIGFGLFFHNFSTFVGKSGIWIEDAYLLPEYRGKGYGKALFKKIAEIAFERNCGRIEWTCLNSNTSSKYFYDKLGAVPMNNWTNYRFSEEQIKDFIKDVATK